MVKKSDWLLIICIVTIALFSYLVLSFITQKSANIQGEAVVYYNDERILTISLIDGSYEIINEDRVLDTNTRDGIYHVLGSNPYGVYIQYDNHQVRVIDEESPKHICQLQGWTNSPIQPLTCLPNNIIIIIEKRDTNLPDDITG